MSALPRVVVVAFDRISPFHLSVPCLVLGESAPWGRVSGFNVTVCAAEPGVLRTTAGFEIQCKAGLAALATAEIVIVPSWRDVAEPPPGALLRHLRAAHRRGARVVGLCLGAYALAAAGLLAGRQATTHWAYADDFARRYPEVSLKPDVLYIEHERVLTSAGVSAGIDCCLHLVRDYYGQDVASRVARQLVVPPHREGGQAQFIEQPLARTPADLRIAELLDWLRAHLQLSHPLDATAARLTMSRRSFTRRFHQLTGATLGQWLLAERLALARRQLETTTQSIEAIATACGFAGAISLRQQFARRLQTTPSAYRRAFRDPAQGMTGGT